MVVDDDSILGAFLANHADISAKPTYSSGTAFGEWSVTGFIGRGGSSEVYCVRHRTTGEHAALKVLHRTEDRHKERFRRESEFLKGNENEALPRFYGEGLKDSRPYIVMELLEPQPLPSDDGNVARYLCAVAEGLAWLHVCGYVHRDIKPRNILFRKGKKPIVIDFGLIKEIVHEPVQKSDELSIVDGREVGMGTPRYAAPEQFDGGEATPATDIHALGRLAYECFGGHPPRAWSRIIRRATSSIPGERYQTAWDFIHAVRRRHWLRNMTIAVFTSAVAASAVSYLASTGCVEDAKWWLMWKSTTTNVAFARITSQTFSTNEWNFVYPTKIVYSTYTNSVGARIVRLNGATNTFIHPLQLDTGHEYWIVGPGLLDASFVKSQGAVVRISNCTLLNRTRESLKDAGIRYVIYKNSFLDFKNISRDIDEEKTFLALSTLDFPDDNTVKFKGETPPCRIASAKVKYMKTEKQKKIELEMENAIRNARLKEETAREP